MKSFFGLFFLAIFVYNSVRVCEAISISISPLRFFFFKKAKKFNFLSLFFKINFSFQLPELRQICPYTFSSPKQGFTDTGSTLYLSQASQDASLPDLVYWKYNGVLYFVAQTTSSVITTSFSFKFTKFKKGGRNVFNHRYWRNFY